MKIVNIQYFEILKKKDIMAKIFINSDLHINHTNILKYCNRPFKTIQEFEDTYVEFHNSKIGPNDFWLNLGDLMHGRGSSLKYLKNFIKRLNGRKLLILGNHDTFSPCEYVKIGFEFVGDYMILNNSLFCHYPLTLNQYPVEKILNNKKHKFEKIYHGHTHEREIKANDNIERINCCYDKIGMNFIEIEADLLGFE